MKLYFSKGACSLSVRITANELQIPLEYEAVDLKEKKTKTGNDYLKINPKGSVPALLLDNQELLTENIAIMQYLVEKQGDINLLPSVEDFKRYRVLEFLSFIASDIHKSFGPLFHPQYSEETKEKFREMLNKKFAFLDKALDQNKFLVNDQFTLADIYLFVVMRWTHKFKIELPFNLSRYFKDLHNRASIKKSLEEEEK